MTQVTDLKLAARPYDTPQLKLYGSVQALTASGTGPMPELGGPAPSGPCYDGVTQGTSPGRKHCV
jgi:hypothetical protein